MKKKRALSAMILIGIFLTVVLSACPGGNNDPKESEDTLYSINLEQAPNGTIGCEKSSARKGTGITITAVADSGYRVEWIKWNGTNIQPSGSTYAFIMPTANVTVTASFVTSTVTTAYNIYNSGLNQIIIDNSDPSDNPDGWKLETTWGDPANPSNLAGNVTNTESIPGPNPAVNLKPIKIDITKITDYFALTIPLDGMNINFKDVNTLTLWAKAGTNTSGYIRYAGINRVAFGDYTDNEWGKSVWYCGENVPDQKYIPLDASWKQITVPVPRNIDHDINTLTFFFTTDQVAKQVIYIDIINFNKTAESAELVEVSLPAAGSVAYGKTSGSPLASDLELITRNTRFVYSIEGSRFTLYGEDPADGADSFLNKMSDFYDSNNIAYTATAGTVAGKRYTPASTGSNFILSVSYSGKKSSDMNITVKGLPQTAVGGELVIDDFNNIQTVNDSGKILVQLPYYWGGTAGDAQCYSPTGPMNCWVANVLFPDPTKPLDTGVPLDTWYIVGNLDKNLNLTGTTKISISIGLGKGVTWRFTLSSGYTGVPSTLKDGTKKYEKTITLVGSDDAFYETAETYTFNLSDFKNAATTEYPDGDPANNNFDWSNVTAFQFYTDAKLNEPNKTAISSVTDPFNMKVWEIKAHN